MIYNELIISNWKNPMNFGKIANRDFYWREENVLCGDSVEIFLKVVKGKIRAKFLAKGCVLTIASGSILTQILNGTKLEEAKKFSEKELIKLMDIEVGNTRKKCLLLPLVALKKALKDVPEF